MKPTDLLEGFLIQVKYFWQDAVGFLFQLTVWIVGSIIIAFLEMKEFYEKRMKK